jgi:16S rRNA (cytosine967-C5)-methyltransferase
MNSRTIAANIIADWLETGKFPDRLIDSAFPSGVDQEASRAFVTELVMGVVKHRRALNWLIAQCSTRHPAPPAMPYLLIGLYQTLFLSNVADHAAVNETVEVSKKALPKGLKGFVNAVLRRSLRERDTLLSGLSAEPLATRESHPGLLVDRWAARWGLSDAERLCRWNNSRPQVVIRVNQLQVSTADYVERLAAAGIVAEPHASAPGRCVAIPRGVPVPELPGYAEGVFVVQDPSALVAVELLAPAVGESVLDVCAAPGGKTSCIAELMRGEGRLVAADMHQDRVDVLEQNLARLGLSWVDARCMSAERAALVFGTGAFDAVLVDAPCSNTGVLRRRADARWRFELARMRKLVKLQESILDSVAGLVKVGGRLVYSTCSLEPEECGGQVAAWLARHKEFELCEERSLFPPDCGTDGGYCALLRRRA